MGRVLGSETRATLRTILLSAEQWYSSQPPGVPTCRSTTLLWTEWEAADSDVILNLLQLFGFYPSQQTTGWFTKYFTRLVLSRRSSSVVENTWCESQLGLWSS
jgi:hypothetical protein